MIRGEERAERKREREGGEEREGGRRGRRGESEREERKWHATLTSLFLFRSIGKTNLNSATFLFVRKHVTLHGSERPLCIFQFFKVHKSLPTWQTRRVDCNAREKGKKTKKFQSKRSKKNFDNVDFSLTVALHPSSSLCHSSSSLFFLSSPSFSPFPSPLPFTLLSSSTLSLLFFLPLTLFMFHLHLSDSTLALIGEKGAKSASNWSSLYVRGRD